MTRLRAKFVRGFQVSAAFIGMEFRSAINYPLGYVMRQLGTLLPAVIYYFVAQLVTPDSDVGGDYYTFVIVGLIGIQALEVGMRSFSLQLEGALERGWFEMILVAPVRWSLLPFGMVQWSIVQAVVRILVILAVAIGLGAVFAPDGIVPGVTIMVLAIAVGFSLGVLLAGIKVLAKSGDPLLPFYSMGAQVFGGVYFPVDSLPSWLQPISFLFPHTYAISALRRAVMPGGADLPGLSAGAAIAILVGITVVLFPIAMLVYKRSMELGRRMGVLAGY